MGERRQGLGKLCPLERDGPARLSQGSSPLRPRLQFLEATISTYQRRYATFEHVPWGVVELEPEVVEWIQGLLDEQFGRVEFHIDLLEEKGVHLDQPYTRQLRGKLRELRFYLGPVGDAVRISYYVARGRRIILLTVFKKQRRREQTEIDRAERAMTRCIEQAHDAEDDSDG